MGVDVVEVTRYVNSRDAPYSRLWSDNQLVDVVAGLDHPEGDLVTVTEWLDRTTEAAYWDTRKCVIASTHFTSGERSCEFNPDTWLTSVPPGRDLPGATFTFVVELTGLALDPAVAAATELGLQDGRVVEDRGVEADLVVRGSVRDVVSWATGLTPFRNIARRVHVDGDLLLLGAAAGVLGMHGGFGFDRDLPWAADGLASLVEDHRNVADEGLRWCP